MYDYWNISIALNVLLVTIIVVLSSIAILRRDKISRLQIQKLRNSQLEVAFQQKALFESGLITVTDTNGIILEVNKKFLGAFGYRRENLLGTDVQDLYPDEEKDLCMFIRQRTKTGGMWSGEAHLIRADGSKALTQNTVVPLLDANGNHIKNLSLRFDISRQKAKENQKLVTSAFDEMTDSVILYDPIDFSISYMNAIARAEHGWDMETLDGKTLWDTRYVSDPSKMAEQCKALSANGKCTTRIENETTGEIFEAHSYRVAVTHDTPRVLTMFCEVTRTVELERERSRLISIITHELRTPLTSIKGAMGLLDSCALGPMPSEAKNLVGIALRNSDRMLDLIAQILESEKAGHDARHAPLAPLNLAETIEMAITANQCYGTELGVTFRDPIGTQELWVNGSEPMLEQILANLMSNAAKFSPDGGLVDIWAEREGEHAIICVRDHGTGIPADLQPKLFGRFIKADQEVRGNVHGSGLGLSIVKSQVDRLGGTIDFDTARNVGTCFRITLPLSKAQCKAITPPRTASPIHA